MTKNPAKQLKAKSLTPALDTVITSWQELLDEVAQQGTFDRELKTLLGSSLLELALAVRHDMVNDMIGTNSKPVRSELKSPKGAKHEK